MIWGAIRCEKGDPGLPGSPCQVDKDCSYDGNLHIATMVCPDGSAVDWPAGKCGDGYLDDDCEACDDGNLTNEDGCRDDCTSEICGDGIVDPGEECDDGNTDDLDGCNASCADEGTCETSGEYCNSNGDCPAVPGICPAVYYGGAWHHGTPCSQGSECHFGYCNGPGYQGICTNDSNCSSGAFCDWTNACSPNPNDCTF